MDEKEAREAYFELKVIEEQMSQLQRQIAQLESHIAEFEDAMKSLEELRNKEQEETLVPVSSGIYAKARLEDTNKFIVNVGAGVAVEKTLDDTKDIIEKQLGEMRSYRGQMVKGLQLLGSRAEEIQHMVAE